jgi:hypothetical protein
MPHPISPHTSRPAAADNVLDSGSDGLFDAISQVGIGGQGAAQARGLDMAVSRS